MTLVAVAAHRAMLGVEAPGHKKKIRGRTKAWTYDWREAPGSPGNTARVENCFAVRPLKTALEDRYDTDAHLVAYTMVDRDGAPLLRQPRLNKSCLDWLRAEGFEVWVDCLFADVDNEGHAPWNEELERAFREMRESPPDVLRSCGFYTTRHGYRLVQPLDEPVSVPEAERYTAGWLAEFATAGIDADARCCDWTRLYRLHDVKRRGR